MPTPCGHRSTEGCDRLSLSHLGGDYHLGRPDTPRSDFPVFFLRALPIGLKVVMMTIR